MIRLEGEKWGRVGKRFIEEEEVKIMFDGFRFNFFLIVGNLIKRK